MDRYVRILDGYYAGQLGCSPDDLNSGRLITVANDNVCSILFAKGVPLVIFALAKGTGGVVSARAKLKPALDEAFAGFSSLDDRAWDAVEAALSSCVDARFWFRGCRLFCSPESFIDRSMGEARAVTHEDETAAALHAKWGGEVFGQIMDGKVVSWAAVKPLSDVAWDLSIKTLVEYRGRGCAKSAVSAAVKYIFDNGKLATWGTDCTNIASQRTARSVGFVDYARDFGCVTN